MLVNATRKAFKSAAVHVGHVDIEDTLTNSSHSFLFFILFSHLLQLTAVSSFTGSFFGLQHFCREIPFMGNACNPELKAAQGAQAGLAATPAPHVSHYVFDGKLSRVRTFYHCIAAKLQWLISVHIHPVHKVKCMPAILTVLSILLKSFGISLLKLNGSGSTFGFSHFRVSVIKHEQ